MEGDLKGILSDRDIARFFCEDQPDEVKTAADLMTQSIISVDPRTSVEVASILLLEGQISCLPVISEDNQLVGILTWKDLLKFLRFRHLIRRKLSNLTEKSSFGLIGKTSLSSVVCNQY